MAPREVDACGRLWKRAGGSVATGLSAPENGGPNASAAIDQTGDGAIQRVHLGPLNRTFPALYFPGSPLSVENHCFGPLGQTVSF